MRAFPACGLQRTPLCWVAVLSVVALLAAGCGQDGAAWEPTGASEHEADASVEGPAEGRIHPPAREPKPPQDPFVWEASEILAHVGLTDAVQGALRYGYEASDGTACHVTVLTSAMAVRLHHESGHLLVTNPSATAGLYLGEHPEDACRGKLVPGLGGLEAAPRDAAARRADLEALDAALLEAAELHVPDGTFDDGWWPGVEVSVADDTVTVSGTSLGRCRQASVTRDGTVTGPSSC